MGKSVINNDPFAYKPEYNQQVSGTKVVAPPNSKAGENDPFAYRPEYNTDVKKKVGGTESEIGITEPAPTQSELQSKKENATNFLITDINQNDFFSKLAGQTDQYFSHTTPQRVNEQAAAVTQNEVFRNPASLQRYTDQRIKDLNEDITNIGRQQAELVEMYQPDPIGAPTSFSKRVTDKKRYDQLSQSIIEKEQYKKQLKNNVAEIAADQILSQTDLSGGMDLGKIGRQISSIADPEQEAIFKMAEKGGKTLPGIRQEQMNYTGLQAIKSYLSRNPDIPNYDQIVKNVNDLESDIDERNPQTTALRVKEKIGAQLYKDGKSSFFGFGYSPNTLKEAADNPETALTTSERKVFNEVVLPTERRLVGTDIPTSGFTRSFYNAIEKGAITMGKTLGDVTGLRNESEQAADVLTQEQAGARYRPAGESPTAQGQLAYLNAKEKTAKLTESEQQQKKELENYTYVRNGWSKFKDGVGDLTGQVAMIALATKGLGAAGEALIASGAEGGLLGGMTRTAIGQALSNETVGLFATSYLNAFDNYKQQAIQLMPGEDKAANRTAYATVMSSVEALSERIFPDTKILTAFTKGVAPTIKDITTKFITREITQQVARDEMQKALTVGMKTFGKEFLKSTGQEATEEAVVDLAQGIADSTFGGQPFDIVKTGQQALNTFLTTALYSPLVAGMAGRGAMREHSSHNTFMKSAITDMAANPAQYLQSVEDLQLEGTITQQEANEKIKLIKSANQYLQEIPLTRTVTTKTGEGKETKQVDQNKSFDYPETSSYLLHRLNEGILNDQIENTTDEVVKSKLQKDLKRSQEIRKGLFDGSIGITPDLKEVTDNEEKADELGIFNTKQVQTDELIGTPFEQQKKADEKKPENQNTEATGTQSHPETAQAEIPQAPKISSEQTLKETTDFANELIKEGVIPKGYQEMAKKSPLGFFEFVAQQAQNVDANWQSLKETDAPLSEQAAIDAFGETVVDYAKELFPIQPKINNDERQKQETVPASEEGGGEKVTPKTSTEGNESQGNEVLAKQGEQSMGSQIEKQTHKNLELKNDNIWTHKQHDLTEEEWGNLQAAIRNAKTENDIINIIDGNLASKGIHHISFLGRILGNEDWTDKLYNTLLAYGKYDIQIPLKEYLKDTHKALSEHFDNLKKTETNENQISQEGSTQKVNEENGKQQNGQNAGQENDEKGNEVVTEQGAEPAAEAPLELTEEDIQKPLEATRAKKVSGALRDFATKIQKADITGAGGTSAQSDITRVPRETIAFAINRVADAIDAGEAVVNAIQKGVDYIREQGHKMDDDSFKTYTTDLISGKKPRVRISTEPQENKSEENKTEGKEPQKENNEPPTPPRPPSDEAQTEEGGNIDDYEMTTSGEVNRFLSGNTWEDVFGDKAEGDQTYLTQKLSDMLQDGKNMIAIAQQKWGGDVMMYAKPLFQLIQGMSNDKAISNKKAVLLATLLGELQEAKKRSPERFDAISQIEKAVFAYYQNYMNVRGKEIVAGRLLRLYRDKYIGDIYADMILEKEQVKAKKAIQEIEQNKQIDDKTVSEETKPITEEEKKKEDKAAKKKSDTAKKVQSKKKKMTTEEAKQRADSKVREIEEKMGKDGRGGLIDRIKEAIKKLNCK